MHYNDFFGGIQCIGHFFAYVAHFIFLSDVWIRTHGAAVTSRRNTNLANHLPKFATHLPELSHPPHLATHLPYKFTSMFTAMVPYTLTN